MPAWGPSQVNVTSQSNADIPYAAAQSALLNFGRLYDPLVADAVLMGPESSCPGPPAPRGWSQGCASIVGSSLTVPNLRSSSSNQQELSWVDIQPGDTFEGVLSTIGVEAICGPAPDAYFDWSSIDYPQLVFPTLTETELRNPIALYGATESYFVTPNVQIMTIVCPPWGR
ncbi:hypothetical protein HKX48_005202 [Thoreauomyces humboldtii]|nr:hypothetical protein HKX48_005202 [Thoreauomyces humboldtii]